MAKKQPQSDLYELLKLLRRIIVLAIAAYGLMRGMPYVTLAVRLAILWAILYVSSGLVDVVFRHLNYRSMLRTNMADAVPEKAAAKAVQKAK
jgi:hypothetical protein